MKTDIRVAFSHRKFY